MPSSCVAMDRTPDAATLRRIAVEAEADPRTVRRRLRGLPVRGMVRRRIDLTLLRHGFQPGLDSPTAQPSPSK